MLSLGHLEIGLQQVSGGEPDLAGRQAVQELFVLDADLLIGRGVFPDPERE